MNNESDNRLGEKDLGIAPYLAVRLGKEAFVQVSPKRVSFTTRAPRVPLLPALVLPFFEIEDACGSRVVRQASAKMRLVQCMETLV